MEDPEEGECDQTEGAGTTMKGPQQPDPIRQTSYHIGNLVEKGIVKMSLNKIRTGEGKESERNIKDLELTYENGSKYPTAEKLQTPQKTLTQMKAEHAVNEVTHKVKAGEPPESTGGSLGEGSNNFNKGTLQPLMLTEQNNQSTYEKTCRNKEIEELRICGQWRRVAIEELPIDM